MFKLRNLAIRQKLWVLTIITIIGLLAITAIALKEYREDLMHQKVLQIRELVETAYSLIAVQYERTEKGELDMQQAQQQAMDDIKGLRYGETNYFWINDTDARIVMHPIKPKLDGQDMSSFADPDGKKIFSEFASVAKNDGEGVVPYKWPKPGFDEPVNKISFVKSFNPWGWVLGTGVYIDDVETDFWNYTLHLVTTSVTILVILLFLSIAISRSIIKPLVQTTAALNDISMGEGDLTQRLDDKGNDEVAKLSVAFNRFVEKIEQIIIAVCQTSAQLATAAEELSSTTTQNHENLTLQQNETQQVATAVNEMAATVKEIAESAEGAAGSASAADEEALTGKHVVVNVTEAIGNLAGEMTSASDVINLLAKESESIGTVSDVIRGIAEQTSLLALNAAIEAARAGEQGRGFAVVADEVRSLASRTQQATTEIRELIERLQSGIQNAVDVIHRSGETTHATVEKAQTAADSLDRIVSSVALISDRNTQIASASEEQSSVAHEIDRSVVEISQLTEHSLLASQQISQATDELSRLGETMNSMVSKFKTS
ncbi:MAG: methyl-accepting chemotaxis protein [Candidatus Thiodiazotropha sp.]|jgi:methyl-accepting chemotaxis protein